jgi:hypothetical protein
MKKNAWKKDEKGTRKKQKELCTNLRNSDSASRNAELVSINNWSKHTPTNRMDVGCFRSTRGCNGPDSFGKPVLSV